jgi:hypothetical protein
MRPLAATEDVVMGEANCPTENTPGDPLVVCREQRSDHYRIPPSERNKQVTRSSVSRLSFEQTAVLEIALKAYDPKAHFCVRPWLSGEPISYENRGYATPRGSFSALKWIDAKSFPSFPTPRSIRSRVAQEGNCLILSTPRIVKDVADLLIDNPGMTPPWHIIRLRRVRGSWTVVEREGPDLG